jgi:CheY-like chemotaxis protein
MYIVVREYRGEAQDVVQQAAQRQDSLKAAIRGIAGLVAYYAVDTGNGGVTSVSVFEDRAGAATRRRPPRGSGVLRWAGLLDAPDASAPSTRDRLGSPPLRSRRGTNRAPPGAAGRVAGDGRRGGVRADRPPSPPPPPTPDAPPGGAPPPGRRTVLVVDDDPVVAGLVQTVLSDEGYAVSVLTALTSDAVRTAVGRLEPDCLLLDSRAPTDDGESWLDAAWAHARERAVPVVLFTASADALREAAAGESARSRAAGLSAVVGKPFDLDDLLATVARAVGSVAPFDRTAGADARRPAALAAALAAAGARDVATGTRREWATFAVGDQVGLVYWSPRDGVYYVLREPAAGGPLRQIGRFHDLAAAVELATAP